MFCGGETKKGKKGKSFKMLYFKENLNVLCSHRMEDLYQFSKKL